MKTIEEIKQTRNLFIEAETDNDGMGGYYYGSISEDKCEKYCNYITNLQEKYDKALTDLVHESHKRIELENKITNLQEENRQTKLLKERYQLEKETYKSINEKAIEVLKNTLYPDIAKAKALNILQGEDKDVNITN